MLPRPASHLFVYSADVEVPSPRFRQPRRHFGLHPDTTVDGQVSGKRNTNESLDSEVVYCETPPYRLVAEQRTMKSRQTLGLFRPRVHENPRQTRATAIAIRAQPGRKYPIRYRLPVIGRLKRIAHPNDRTYHSPYLAESITR